MDAKLKHLIGGLAPTIATLLGGPGAGMAVTALSNAVLGKPNGTEEELQQAIKTATPDTYARVKEAEAKLKADLANAGVKAKEIAAGEFAQAQATARVEAVSTDEYVRRTRPLLARRSFYIGCAYLVFCAACSISNALKPGLGLPGIQEWILLACWSPLLSYIGSRGVESFSKNGKI